MPPLNNLLYTILLQHVIRRRGARDEHLQARACSAGAGLAEERRAALLSEVGPNRIAFDVDPLGVALRKEFFSYFYLYQFQLYVVWLWFSYVFVALALIAVVLLAGLANVAIARANQRKIASLTRSATRCRVRVRREGGAASGGG